MSLFRKSAKQFMRRKSRVKTVHIDEVSDLAQWMYWGSGTVKLRLLIPAEILRMHGAFAYRSGAHPFIEALEIGPEALSAYYAAHQPQTAAEAHWLRYPSPGVGPIELPWIVREAPNTYTGEKGLGIDHGISMYGPCSEKKVKLEYTRLRDLSQSIARRGYDPDGLSDITGNFLRKGNDFRFFVTGGKHRAAVLGHIGTEHIPVTFTDHWPRVVDDRESRSWPIVVHGRLSEQVAQGIFDSYFHLNGVQQYEMLGLSQSPKTRPVLHVSRET
jgi:hypothetical protein